MWKFVTYAIYVVSKLLTIFITLSTVDYESTFSHPHMFYLHRKSNFNILKEKLIKEKIYGVSYKPK